MRNAPCVCKKRSVFLPYITYRKETVFKNYEGIIIGKCNNCGILKTFPKKRGGNFNPIVTKSKEYEKRKKEFEEMFRPIVERILNKVKPNAKILDVGCSSGILLSLLKQKGFEVYGLEPNKQAYAIAKKKLGKGIFNRKLSDYVRNQKVFFDCIIYNHVLEHIEKVNEEFSMIKKILRKNGILIVGVPNTDNIIFKIRGKYWESLLPNEHVWHFSAKYLSGYLARQGFEVLNVCFEDDARKSYSFLKRIYFTILSLVNKTIGTGEAMLLLAKK